MEEITTADEFMVEKEELTNEIQPRDRNFDDMSTEELRQLALNVLGDDFPEDMADTEIINALEEHYQLMDNPVIIRDSEDDAFAPDTRYLPKAGDSDNIVLVPPFGKKVEALEYVDPMTPGDFKLSKDGKLYKTVFEYQGKVGSVIETFDNWVANVLEKQINSRKLTTGAGEITFEKKYFLPPRYATDKENKLLYPINSTVAGTSYSAELYVDMVLNKGKANEQRLDNKIFIGRIPVMIGSVLDNLRTKSAQEKQDLGMCSSDDGGYFIINGNEKVVLIQENLRVGRMFTFASSNKGEPICRMTVNTPVGSSIITLGYKPKDQSIVISLPFMGRPTVKSKKIGNNVSIFQIYRMLGLTDVSNMTNMILKYARPEWKNRVMNKLLGSLLVFNNIGDDIRVIKDMMEDREKKEEKPEKKKRGKKAEKKKKTDEEWRNDILAALNRELFPQIEASNDDSATKKLEMLSIMVARFTEYLAGYRQLDDRDHWGNKRLESAGRSMEKLFNGLWRNLISMVQAKIDENALKTLDEVRREISASYIENAMFDSMNIADNWGVPGQMAKENIVETLKRDNPLAQIVHTTKISVPTNRLAKQPKLRMVHESQLGYICPAHTPEGDQCGLIKNSAVTLWITLENDGDVILDMVENFLKSEPSLQYSSVFWLNNRPQGWCEGKVLKDVLIKARRQNLLPKGTAIVLDSDNVLNVFCDGGRPTRPLLVMDEDGQLRINKLKAWGDGIEDLLRKGCVEYIDAYEQDYIRLAVNVADAEEKYVLRQTLTKKKMELLEQIKMNENIESLEAEENVAKLQSELNDVEANINSEFLEQPYTHCEIHPSAYMGIALSLIPMANFDQGPRQTYSCAHQSQALGSYHSNHRSRYDTTFKTISHPSPALVQTELYDIFGMREHPTGENIRMAFMIYTGLNQEDSLIFNQAAIDRGLFRMVVYKSFKLRIEGDKNVSSRERFARPEPGPHEDKSRYAAIDENGYPIVGTKVKEGDYIIGKIRETPNGVQNASMKVGIGVTGIICEVIKTNNMIRVKIREERIPEVGDKFASRHAQKATAGSIMPAVDMPFDTRGLVPDVLVNPHSIPSRMTMGMLFEILMGKTATLTGEFQNATSHRAFNIDIFKKKLLEYGYTDDGNETFINGKTGKMMKCRVFTGPCYYMALRHHVRDKIQVRGRGAVDSATHQPNSGRSRNGGLRLGEMERDAIISHGGSETLRERLCLVSDAHNVPHCLACGNIAVPNIKEETFTCSYCDSSTDFGTCEYPFVVSLMFNYLAAAGIKVDFKFKKST